MTIVPFVMETTRHNRRIMKGRDSMQLNAMFVMILILVACSKILVSWKRTKLHSIQIAWKEWRIPATVTSHT